MDFFFSGLIFFLIIAVGLFLIYALTWLTFSYRKLSVFFFFWLAGSFIGVICGVIFFYEVLESIADSLQWKRDTIFVMFTSIMGLILPSIYASLSGWKQLLERTKNPFSGVRASNLDLASIFVVNDRSKILNQNSSPNSPQNSKTKESSSMEGQGGQSGGAGASSGW